MRLAVVGARGRMGATVLRLAGEHGFTVTRAVDRTGEGEVAGVRLESSVEALASGGFDVAIDFSTTDTFPTVVAAVAASGAALVSGTTGLSAGALARLDEAGTRIPVLWEPNLSVGVHVLGTLLRAAIAALGPGFDVEIVETHHRKKLDAPSGTALRLAEIAQQAGSGALLQPLQNGREGRPGARGTEIGLHAVRGGDVIGDHSIHLLGQGERLELVHRATSRDLFAQGALRAAAWLVGKPPGRYGLGDVLMPDGVATLGMDVLPGG